MAGSYPVRRGGSTADSACPRKAPLRHLCPRRNSRHLQADRRRKRVRSRNCRLRSLRANAPGATVVEQRNRTCHRRRRRLIQGRNLGWSDRMVQGKPRTRTPELRLRSHTRTQDWDRRSRRPLGHRSTSGCRSHRNSEESTSIPWHNYRCKRKARAPKRTARQACEASPARPHRSPCSHQTNPTRTAPRQGSPGGTCRTTRVERPRLGSCACSPPRRRSSSGLGNSTSLNPHPHWPSCRWRSRLRPDRRRHLGRHIRQREARALGPTRAIEARRPRPKRTVVPPRCSPQCSRG